MRVLVVHAWLRGNLGDVLQLSVLLSALRALRPRVLDLAGFPASPADAALDVLARSDRYVADPFAWYWKYSPQVVRRAFLEPRWRTRRKALFSRYDVIVCAPGPYLADYDARAPSALCDIAIADEIGRPAVLSSHSIGPLAPDALATVARAAVRIAREPATAAYLREHGMTCVLSADLAFLYPYGRPVPPPSVQPPYRAVFLRSNNLSARALRIENGALFDGPRLLAGASSDAIVLSTSDCRRDARFLAAVAGRLGVPWIGCRNIAALVGLIGCSTGVVTDRYHPAICGAVLGRPVQVLPNREPHKMYGLTSLLVDRSVEELQDLARAGLAALEDGLRGMV